ncbi:MAG: ABC transporter substrate-binding protein [Puniceicoccales bacterium]|jgi:polar amino acid transport system substrate-binding protein|nr:ABC transporter substrate-binding protein [Puniceicoccales bacterium]
MKKCAILILAITLVMGIVLLLRNGKDSGEEENGTIRFGTEGGVIPMTYFDENGNHGGFEVELAKLIAEKLGKKATFTFIGFPLLPTALQTGKIDVAFENWGIFPETRQGIDYSVSYYPEMMLFMFKKSDYIVNRDQLRGEKISYPMHPIMTKLLGKNMSDSELVPFDDQTTAIEALKSGQVKAVYIDACMTPIYCQKYPEFEYSAFDLRSETEGVAFAFPKGSPLRVEFNEILRELGANGELKALKEKWNLQEEWTMPDE